MTRATTTEFLQTFNTILKRYMLTGNTLATFLSKNKGEQNVTKYRNYGYVTLIGTA